MIPKNDAEYFSHPNTSNSDLKHVNISIANYLEYKKNPPEPTDAMIFGSMFHCYILENKEFFNRYEISKFKEFRTNEAKEYKKEIQSQGIQLIKESDLIILEGMTKSLMQNDLAVELMEFDGFVFPSHIFTEQAYLFNYRKLACKMKCDHVNMKENRIIDLKTIDNAEDMESVIKKIINMKYYRQDTFYKIGFSLANKVMEMPRFIFIFIEKSAPYGIRIVELPEDWFDISKTEIDKDIDSLKYYFENKEKDINWSYPSQIETPEMPNWFKIKNIDL